ncbi:MAG: hypothetical protein ACRELB_11900 [Polyangiaceae bacterium]
MARNSALAWMRIGVAVASWALALWVVQAVGGAAIDQARHDLEERIEQQLHGAPSPPEARHERSHEDDSLEPWELVSV